MTFAFSQKAEKDYKKLPFKLQVKADRRFAYLLTNYRHPSLRTRKMLGTRDIFEGRIDYRYRFTFMVEDQKVLLLSIGPHDTGLGKK